LARVRRAAQMGRCRRFLPSQSSAAPCQRRPRVSAPSSTSGRPCRSDTSQLSGRPQSRRPIPTIDPHPRPATVWRAVSRPVTGTALASHSGSGRSRPIFTSPSSGGAGGKSRCSPQQLTGFRISNLQTRLRGCSRCGRQRRRFGPVALSVRLAEPPDGDPTPQTRSRGGSQRGARRSARYQVRGYLH